MDVFSVNIDITKTSCRIHIWHFLPDPDSEDPAQKSLDNGSTTPDLKVQTKIIKSTLFL